MVGQVRMYRGRQVFGKHFTGKNQVPAFDGAGESGEEFQCAVFLDGNKRVKHWIRNVSKHPNSFSLPLAGGKFYPDFVAELDDGTILVVEYKGAHLASNPDTMEKKTVGMLWERSSAGKGKFLLTLKDDEGLGMQEQLARKID